MSWERFSGKVERCYVESGWFTVAVPESCVPPKELVTGHFGFIPITAKISSSEWDTSLLPAGDGSHFIALPKKVRVKQDIKVDDTVTIEFCLRNKQS